MNAICYVLRSGLPWRMTRHSGFSVGDGNDDGVLVGGWCWRGLRGDPPIDR